MPRKKNLTACPVCGEKLMVTNLLCRNCHTEISGNFEMHPMEGLSQDELDFIVRFLKVQGSIKEMEREMKVSYPTVKKMLDSVNEKLGNPTKSTLSKEDILEKIRTGELSVEQAIPLLKNQNDWRE